MNATKVVSHQFTTKALVLPSIGCGEFFCHIRRRIEPQSDHPTPSFIILMDGVHEHFPVTMAMYPARGVIEIFVDDEDANQPDYHRKKKRGDDNISLIAALDHYVSLLEVFDFEIDLLGHIPHFFKRRRGFVFNFSFIFLYIFLYIFFIFFARFNLRKLARAHGGRKRAANIPEPQGKDISVR